MFMRRKDALVYTFLPWDHRETDAGELSRTFPEQPFGVWMVNSLFLACTYTAVVVTLSSLGGFALAKYRFAGRRPLMLIMLITMLVPGQVLLLPNYELMANWGWMNSYAAILVPGAVSVFGIFLFRQSIQLVRDELLEAGRIDGCSDFASAGRSR